MSDKTDIEIFQSKELLVTKNTEPTIIQSIGNIVYLGPQYEEKKFGGGVNKISGTLFGTNREIDYLGCPFCLNEAIIKKEIVPSLIIIWVVVSQCSEHEKKHHWNNQESSGIEFYLQIIKKIYPLIKTSL